MSFPPEMLRSAAPSSYAEYMACKSGPFFATLPHGERSPEFPTPGGLMAWLGDHHQGRPCTTNVITKHEVESRTYYTCYVEMGVTLIAEPDDMERPRSAP